MTREKGAALHRDLLWSFGNRLNSTHYAAEDELELLMLLPLLSADGRSVSLSLGNVVLGREPGPCTLNYSPWGQGCLLFCILETRVCM